MKPTYVYAPFLCKKCGKHIHGKRTLQWCDSCSEKEMSSALEEFARRWEAKFVAIVHTIGNEEFVDYGIRLKRNRHFLPILTHMVDGSAAFSHSKSLRRLYKKVILSSESVQQNYVHHTREK